MSKRKGRKNRAKPKLNEGETPHLNLPKDGYILGFKRKNFNELWDWNTLEDVDFSTWRPAENSNHKYGNS